ncbi:MAG: acyl-CoA dehydratase activase-related protein, partial [Anaerostipes hadrus]
MPKTERDITIGIPRVLSYWDTMPFWTTFFKSLGYKVQLSDESTREIYESGLSAVTSDTVCFPAKLVHGHLRNLVKKYHVDRIFMPSITTVPPENTEKTSESMCAVVKGYPIVIRNSDNPQDKWNVPFDAPLFHWHTKKDRQRQLVKYMEEVYHVSKEEVMNAMHTADQARKSFDQQLKKRGEEILNEVKEKNEFAVVLASRPYQNDTLV